VSIPDVVAFLSLVAFGAAVQSITGFAMGLIIMGGVGAFGLADIGFGAAVVSIVSATNTTIALRHTHKFVDRRTWLWIIAGLLPMTVAGVFLLHALSGDFYQWLRVFLGVVIISAGTLLMLKPTPFARKSGRVLILAMGSIGGLIGGMYGAGGAPLAWLMYRQPMDVNRIRATLLATFFVSTSSRIVTITATGHFSREMLYVSLASIPVVILVTLGATRIAHKVPDKAVRRAVFTLLVVLGASLILR